MEVFINSEAFFEVSIRGEVILKSGTVCAQLPRTVCTSRPVCTPE
jgi:hypothetical protein